MNYHCAVYMWKEGQVSVPLPTKSTFDPTFLLLLPWIPSTHPLLYSSLSDNLSNVRSPSSSSTPETFPATMATDTTASPSQMPQGQTPQDQTQQGLSRFETLTLEELVTLIEQGKEQKLRFIRKWNTGRGSRTLCEG